MSDIRNLFMDFKDDVEKLQYIEKQQSVIVSLIKDKEKLQKDIEHLKELLMGSQPLLNTPENKVETIIVSVEEGLIDRQIDLLQSRAMSELTLEDVKKLDLLLKNKNIIKDQNKTVKGETNKVDKKNFSNAQLIQIVNNKKPDNGKE